MQKKKNTFIKDMRNMKNTKNRKASPSENYKRKAAAKLLREVADHEAYLEYYKSVANDAGIPKRKLDAMMYRIKRSERIIEVIKTAAKSMTADEKAMLKSTARGIPVEEIMEELNIERSTAYRRRASALDKISALLF